MDGENNGKPYLQMDDLGGFNPLFSETAIYVTQKFHNSPQLAEEKKNHRHLDALFMDAHHLKREKMEWT